MGGKTSREEEQQEHPTAYSVRFCFSIPPWRAFPTWPGAVLFITVNEGVFDTVQTIFDADDK